MNTDDSIHVACANTNDHSFAKTGESLISPIRPSLVDQTESDGECSDVVGAVEFYISGPNNVKLNSNHDSPVSVGKGEDVSRPDLGAGAPGKIPVFPMLCGTSRREIALASNLGTAIAVPVSYPNTPPRASSFNNMPLFAGFNVNDGASAGLLNGSRSPGNVSPKHDAGNNRFSTTGAQFNFAVESGFVSVPSRTYHELVESGATQLKHIQHLQHILVESRSEQEFLMNKREEMATYCKSKCLELKALFESKLDEQRSNSDSALQALRISLASANRLGEVVDGERIIAMKAAQAAIDERDKVVLEIRALRLGLHVGTTNFKVYTPEEQDSGESNKFGSAGSNAIGSTKQSQGYAAATSADIFVDESGNGRKATATPADPFMNRHFPNHHIGESPYSFNKLFAPHPNLDTMPDFFAKLTVESESSTMLHPTTSPHSYGPSIINRGASISYMTVTEPNPLFSGHAPVASTHAEATSSGGVVYRSTGIAPSPGLGNPLPNDSHSQGNGNGKSGRGVSENPGGHGGSGGPSGNPGGSGGPGGPPNYPNPFNMPTNNGRMPDKDKSNRKVRGGGGGDDDDSPPSSSSSSSDESPKKKKKKGKKKHIISDSDSDGARSEAYAL